MARNYGVEVKTPGTREVKIRNADGSESIQIVPDTPGQSFSSAAPVDKPPDIGSFEDFVTSKYGARPAPAQQLEARREWEASGRAPKDAPEPPPC
jgi:hypothetical protein